MMIISYYFKCGSIQYQHKSENWVNSSFIKCNMANLNDIDNIDVILI